MVPQRLFWQNLTVAVVIVLVGGLIKLLAMAYHWMMTL